MMNDVIDVMAAAEEDARHQVERELRQLERARPGAPDLEEWRRRMPRANGDQDTW